MSDEVRAKVQKAALLEAAHDSGAGPETRRLAIRLADSSAIEVDDDFRADAESASRAFAEGLKLADEWTATRQPAPEPEKPSRRGRRTPAMPRGASDGSADPTFISPEEYARLPDSVRLSEAVQKRLERSRRFYPGIVPARWFK